MKGNGATLSEWRYDCCQLCTNYEGLPYWNTDFCLFLLQIERAHKILRVLRGPRWNVTKELTDIKVALEGRETYHVNIRDFASATVWKPFLIALSLMFFFQFSGINVILHYTVDIFSQLTAQLKNFS